MKFYLKNFISLFRSTGDFIRTPNIAQPQDKPIIKNAFPNHESVEPISTQDTTNTQTLLPSHDSSKPLPTRDKDETPTLSRQQWSSPVEFLLSCISMSVGLGNVWRFPFTAYENGGGAFLIPYLLVLLLVGRPLYFLELSLGQFSSSGSVKVWDLAPAFRGVGFGQVLATCCVVSYYCSLIALSIYYLAVSRQAVLPWTVCHPDLADNLTLCVPSGSNKSILGDKNLTRISSSEQYFRAGVLKEKPDISSGIGFPDPALSVCLAVCWVLLYLTLRKGVASSGKVAYFTAIFPYIVMFTLLVRGLTLPGASKGLLYFFTPQWHRLLDPNLGIYWKICLGVFIPICLGTILSYAMYMYKPPSYGDIPLSLPAQIVGWILVTLGVLFIPFMFVLNIFNSRGTLLERLSASFSPSTTWGPLDIQDRYDWVRNKEEQGGVTWTPQRTVIQLSDELTNINIDTSEDAQAEMDEAVSCNTMYIGGQYIYQ